MQPKKIIIKTLNKKLNTSFCNALKKYPKLNFINKKTGGEYITIIKCHNYYEGIGIYAKSSNFKNIYGSYIYLYTTISMILSEVIISFFERKIILRLLNYYSYYFSNAEIKRIKNISFAILDPNFPSNNSKRLYLYKKDLILNRLLLNFRHHNYLTIEAFANFSLENYSNFLDNVLEKAAHIYFSNANHADLINFILNNLLK